jgi:hypothetical protein
MHRLTCAVPMAFVLLVAGAFPGCRAPHTELTPAQLEGETDLTKLMWFLATAEHPGYDLSQEKPDGNLSKEDLAVFLNSAAQVLRGARRLEDPTFSKTLDAKAPEFKAFAQALQAKTKPLEEAAAAGDGPKTLETALKMRAACKACHDQFR